MSHRTQITLTDSEYMRLRVGPHRRRARRTRRRAVTVAYGDLARSDTIQVLEVTFGAWQDRKIDGEPYVERVRCGMAYRLAR